MYTYVYVYVHVSWISPRILVIIHTRLYGMFTDNVCNVFSSVYVHVCTVFMSLFFCLIAEFVQELTYEISYTLYRQYHR